MRRLLLAITLALASPAAAQPARGPERFAPEIEAFAAADRAQPPPPCGFLFVGSSSIRFWRTLAVDMAPIPIINRGFGGSTVADVDALFDKVVTPYRPRAIIFYAGENDLSAGKTPAQIVADFARFMDLKTRALGQTPVWFISLKPSKQRWAQLAQQGEVNDAVKAHAARRHDLHYIDIVSTMIEGGKPKEIFIGDGLHMTPEGYVLWTNVIRPAVEAEAKRPTACKAD